MFILTRGFIFCIFFSNPTFLITWLVILRFILGLFFLNNLRNWIIYVVILLFTGGIIILFSYITSLVMSSKINFPSQPKLLFLSTLPILFSLNSQSFVLISLKNVFGLYLESFAIIFLFTATYLILILVRIVKIATSLSGPIKSFFTYEK